MDPRIFDAVRSYYVSRLDGYDAPRLPDGLSQLQDPKIDANRQKLIDMVNMSALIFIKMDSERFVLVDPSPASLDYGNLNGSGRITIKGKTYRGNYRDIGNKEPMQFYEGIQEHSIPFCDIEEKRVFLVNRDFSKSPPSANAGTGLESRFSHI